MRRQNPFLYQKLALLAAIPATLWPSSVEASSHQEVIDLLNGLRSRIQSFDVVVTCNVQHALHTTEKRVVAEGHVVKVPDIHVRPLKDVLPITHTYRQVLVHTGPSSVPLRYVEEFEVTSVKQISILTFDGSVRRSYYASQSAGLVGRAPGANHSYIDSASDYSLIYGVFTPNTHQLFSELAQGLPEGSVTLIKNEQDTIIHLMPQNPRNAASRGYRLWLDGNRGLMLRRLQRYAITPDANGEYSEHRDTNIVINEFHKAGATWVPIRAAVTRFIDRGKLVGEVSSHTEIVVNTRRSTWNGPVAIEQFAFDFPPGTRVFHEMLGTTIVVGDKAAGTNLDDLVSNATAMFPEPKVIGAAGTLKTGAPPAARSVPLIVIIICVVGCLFVGVWIGLYLKTIRMSR